MRKFVNDLILLIERGEIVAEFCGYRDGEIPVGHSELYSYIKFYEKGRDSSFSFVSSGIFRPVTEKRYDKEVIKLSWKEYYAIKKAAKSPNNSNNSRLASFLSEKVEMSNDKILTNKKV